MRAEDEGVVLIQHRQRLVVDLPAGAEDGRVRLQPRRRRRSLLLLRLRRVDEHRQFLLDQVVRVLDSAAGD